MLVCIDVLQTLIYRGLHGDTLIRFLVCLSASGVSHGAFRLSDNKKRTLTGVLRRGGLIIQVLNSVVRFFRGKFVSSVGSELVSDCVG